MNFDEQKHTVDDAQVEAVLRHFKESVHSWSEQEFIRPRTVRREPMAGFWRVASNPILGWAVAAVLIVSSVGVPMGIHHQRQVESEQRASLELKQKEAAEAAAHAEELKQELAMDDEDLMRHVDSDISQTTPDAMEPLASMMRDSTNR